MFNLVGNKNFRSLNPYEMEPLDDSAFVYQKTLLTCMLWLVIFGPVGTGNSYACQRGREEQASHTDWCFFLVGKFQQISWLRGSE